MVRQIRSAWLDAADPLDAATGPANWDRGAMTDARRQRVTNTAVSDLVKTR